MNVKDRLWISENEFDNSPWDLLLTIDKDIPEVDLYKKYLTVNKSYYNINLIGACEKSIVRVNGNLAILKHSLQHNTFDGIAEELCYLIARILGVNCAEAKYLGNGLSLFSSVRFNPNLVYSSVYGNSEDVLKYVVRQLQNELVDKPFAGKLKLEFLEDIFKPYANEILEVKGTDYRDIIKWIMNMYNHILKQF